MSPHPRHIMIALAVLVTLGLVGVLHPDRGADALTHSGRTPETEEWSAIAFELEDEVPARALLGGIRNDLLDRRLTARGISWEGFRHRAQDLMSRVSRYEVTNRSGFILADAMARSSESLPVEILVEPEIDDSIVSLDDEVVALVRRLLLQLPAES